MAAEGEEPEAVPLSETCMTFSNIGKTVDGTGYAYLKLDCSKRRIGGKDPLKAIEGYEHLRQVDLSTNSIKDVAPLKSLVHMLRLDLSSNEIASLKPLVDVDEGGAGLFPQLRFLDVSGNALTALPGLPFPALKTANFSKNQIDKCEEAFTGHATLETLDLSENKLSGLTGLANLPALKTFKVKGNEVKDLSALSEFPELTDLDLSSNILATLEAPWQGLPNLLSLGIGANKLPSAKHLEVLRQVPKMRHLQVDGNPFTRPPEEVVEAPPEAPPAEAAEGEEEAEAAPAPVPLTPAEIAAKEKAAAEAAKEAIRAARVEVIVCHWRLETVDGTAVTEQEREEAKQLNLRRVKEEREAKKRAEEEAAAAEAGEA
eukprot:gnl/TRDRNA2_/TRDRNA2_183298_c0_seq1.p1 gnl/TRDRNA2_/TRDRNA2_183298_c0~~gnl/TRDRNA2_/TRDRNA2_183298_c0_seq1.p1  ORF type:complete len:373 (-),score=103.20 gnl/TRDRNA2_/TRDRNA2_183298_c0_seq1:44-1162(-)